LFTEVDASFAICKLTRRSHFEYTTFLNNGLVSWKSKLQSIVTVSSAESEYVALCELTCEVRYLRQLAKGLGFEQKEPTLCFEDNKEASMTTENECSAAGRMKHVESYESYEAWKASKRPPVQPKAPTSPSESQNSVAKRKREEEKTHRLSKPRYSPDVLHPPPPLSLTHDILLLLARLTMYSRVNNSLRLY
jgi:hypothetical protein